MMQLLNKAQITEVYETHIRDAFPPDELKPLDHILRMYNDGVYEVWADSADALTVYACVYTGTTPVLLDYFAVVRGMRGKGVGSGFIRRVADLYPSMMLEVERPEEAENGAAHAVRMRRIAFYERAGFAMTSTRATIFGVPEYNFGVAWQSWTTFRRRAGIVCVTPMKQYTGALCPMQHVIIKMSLLHRKMRREP